MIKAIVSTIVLVAVSGAAFSQSKTGLENPAIDMEGYLRVAREAARYREERRLSESEFLRMAAEPGTIVLDARSKQRFDELHVKGAVNLSFPDFTIDSLSILAPNKNTRILIYCNNNFIGAEQPFPTKIARASLNLSTFIALYSYGYRNIYELGPLLDVKTTRLDLVPSPEIATRDR
jgi:hypothetical protein